MSYKLDEKLTATSIANTRETMREILFTKPLVAPTIIGIIIISKVSISSKALIKHLNCILKSLPMIQGQACCLCKVNQKNCLSVHLPQLFCL